MKAEDLELLEKLRSLDGKSFQDLNGLVDILLLKNYGEAVGNQCGRDLAEVSLLFDFRYEDLNRFLCGLENTLTSPKVEVRNLLAAADFYLTQWSFLDPCSFDNSFESHFPFALYLLSGRAQITVAYDKELQEWTLEAGDVFQASPGRTVNWLFHGGSKAIFYNFPLFPRHASTGRFYRHRRVEVEEE